MVFIKKVSNSDVGDADHVGGNDWDTLDDYYSDVNQDSSRTAFVNTKTRYQSQKLQYRNPANTQTLTVVTPAITSSQDYRFNSQYAYYIFKDGSTYYGKSGITKGIEFSGSVADVVIQSAITATLALSRGGVILFSTDLFPIITPLDIPTSTAPKGLVLQGQRSDDRASGTSFFADTTFPTGRYLIETSGATDGSTKYANLTIRDINAYNLNFATLDAGFLKYESDNVSFKRGCVCENLWLQYMWRNIHLIGAVWWSYFNELSFNNSNNTFIGDADIKLEQGSHTGATNPWPKYNTFMNILANHGGGVGGTLANSLNIIDGSYNIFQNYFIEGTKYTNAIWALTGNASSNVFYNLQAIDVVAPTPDVRVGSFYLSGSTCFDNVLRTAHLPLNGPTSSGYTVAIKSGAYNNHLEIEGYWGSSARIDDSGAGAGNTVVILPGTSAAGVFTKPVITGTAGDVRIIDHRRGAATQGVSTQSGDATTKVFNIAHGCFTTPLTYSVQIKTDDAKGTPIVTADATNLIVTYAVAPPTGTSNLTWVWTAGVY